MSILCFAGAEGRPPDLRSKQNGRSTIFEPARLRRIATRGLKPSFTAIFWLVGFLLILIQKDRMISGDSDLLLHICYGRTFNEMGLHAADPLLTNVTTSPIHHEWLFEWIMATLDAHFGLAGPLFAAAILMGTILSFFFSELLRRRVAFWVSVTYTVLLFFSLTPHLGLRPHLFSWFFTLSLLFLLDRYHHRQIGFFPTLGIGIVLMTVWANIHGGFIIGLVGATAISFGETLFSTEPFSKRDLLRAATLIAALFAATLLNPYGGRLHLSIAYFLSNDFIISHTSDFQSPSLANKTIHTFVLITAAIWIPFVMRIGKVRLPELVIAAGVTLAALKSSRNIPFAGLFALLPAAEHLQQLLSDSSSRLSSIIAASSTRFTSNETKGRGWLIGTLLALVTFILATTGHIDVSLKGNNVPTDALKWIARHDALHERPVLADFLYAGYLLYETPVSKVYLHSLNASVPEHRLRFWLQMGRGTPGWETTIQERHPISWALLKTGTPQARSMLASSCWKVLFRCNNALIFNNSCSIR